MIGQPVLDMILKPIDNIGSFSSHANPVIVWLLAKHLTQSGSYSPPSLLDFKVGLHTKAQT